ncbi:MAG: hypothetical protein AAFR59_02690 [Bacteroidota bacterium]
MPKLILSLFLAFSLFTPRLQAQSPSGGMTPPEFDGKKAAGIYTYKVEKVLRKLKVKDEVSRQKVEAALNAYNSKMDTLSAEYAPIFEELENTFDRNVQIAMQNRDRSQMSGIISQIREVIPPIKLQVGKEEKNLNEVMGEVLSEKQKEKWLKYQRSKRG